MTADGALLGRRTLEARDCESLVRWSLLGLSLQSGAEVPLFDKLSINLFRLTTLGWSFGDARKRPLPLSKDFRFRLEAVSFCCESTLVGGAGRLVPALSEEFRCRFPAADSASCCGRGPGLPTLAERLPGDAADGLVPLWDDFRLRLLEP
ncbi:hypothetical protein BDW68DRAFT_153076 [Aspergillus falconensis]